MTRRRRPHQRRSATTDQIASITALILHYEWSGVPFHELGLVLLVIATGLTVWSGYNYFASYLHYRENGPPA